ncbi:MAG: SDR family oxidoreductase [Spirochaetaceae bacterium]|nr:MAG: SDR family oxidoreductase [Spirochaetaceae bacterium]
MNEKRLEGRIALVTGASRGFGAGIARALAAEGAAVWLTARSQKELITVAEACGGRPLVADVTSGSDWDRVFQNVQSESGRLDILINNAGAGVSVSPLAQTSDADIQHSLDVNLLGTILGCSRAAKLMTAQKSGTIVNLASACAVQAWPGWSVYSAAKAGVLQLTRCLYTELRPHGARATCLVPSWGATDFSRAAGLPEFDEVTAKKCIQPLELGRVVADICALPSHLTVQELILWPLVQQVEPL